MGGGYTDRIGGNIFLGDSLSYGEKWGNLGLTKIFPIERRDGFTQGFVERGRRTFTAGYTELHRGRLRYFDSNRSPSRRAGSVSVKNADTRTGHRREWRFGKEADSEQNYGARFKRASEGVGFE